MLNGFWTLTWVETKIFVREPMGVIGTIIIPVILFIVLGKTLGTSTPAASAMDQAPFNVPILVALVIAVSAVLSLITIISIYREGGILKRLRATPLSPVTILGAHVVVKLVFTVISLALLVIAGRQFFPGALDVNLPSFTVALLLSTVSILSLGFVIASLIPTARFAQPIGAAFLYPMIAVSGLFFSPGASPPCASGCRVQFPHYTRRFTHARDLGGLGLGDALGERGGADCCVRRLHRAFHEGFSVGMSLTQPLLHPISSKNVVHV